MRKQTARIDDWKVEGTVAFPFLTGHIEGHPRQHQFLKHRQQTSTLTRLDKDNGIAETVNTIYRLGKEATW